MCEVAEKKGFEFKLAKGRFNQPEVEIWGCVCGGYGRKPTPKKVNQLKEWPEPETAADVNSFIAFVNYLREFMDPEWVKHEAVPFLPADPNLAVCARDVLTFEVRTS